MAHGRALLVRAVPVLAVATAATLATWVCTQVALTPAGAAQPEVVDVSTGAPQPTVAPPAIVTERIGAAVSAPPASTAGAPGVARQTISVSVRGGVMTIAPSALTVVLHRGSRGYVGTLGPVTVDDARGTLAGWVATVALVDGPADTVEVEPGAPRAVSGLQSEVARAAGGRLDGAVPIMWAPPGGGGGGFEVSATLTAPTAAGAPDSLTVRVALSVS